jgi:ribonuclease P protein component
MISRRHRFHGYNSLRYVYRQGRVARGSMFAVKAALNQKRRDYRVAVVVSRKVNKSAVARNRMRRRLYEVVREFEAKIEQPYDIAITVFQDSLQEVSYKQLKSQLAKQLKQAGVIK